MANDLRCLLHMVEGGRPSPLQFSFKLALYLCVCVCVCVCVRVYDKKSMNEVERTDRKDTPKKAQLISII